MPIRIILLASLFLNTRVMAALGDVVVTSTPQAIAVDLAAAPTTRTIDLSTVFGIVTGSGPLGSQIITPVATSGTALATLVAKSSNTQVCEASISGTTLTLSIKKVSAAAVVTLTATKSTKSATTTVNVTADTKPPVISGITPIDVSYAGQRSTYTISSVPTPTVSDDSGATITPVSDGPVNTTFTLYGNVSVFNVAWTATDGVGNSTTANQSITIRGPGTTVTRAATVVAATGASIPGWTGKLYKDFSLCNINSTGECAFVTKSADGLSALLSNGTRGRTGAVAIVLKQNDNPTGNSSSGPITAFFANQISSTGTVYSAVKRSSLNPATTADSIFTGGSQTFAVGDTVTTLRVGTINTSSSASTVSLAFNNALFMAQSVGSSASMYQPPTTGSIPSVFVGSPVTLLGTGYDSVTIGSFDSQQLSTRGGFTAFPVTYVATGTTGTGRFSLCVRGASTTSLLPTIIGTDANPTNIAVAAGTAGTLPSIAYRTTTSLRVRTGNDASAAATTVVTAGSTMPGGGTLSSYNKHSIDSSGGLAFLVGLNTGKSGLYYRPLTGAIAKLLVEGDAAPGITGFAINKLINYCQADNGKIVIHASTVATATQPAGSPTTGEAVFVSNAGAAPALLAGTGDGVNASGTVRTITGFDLQHVWNNNGTPQGNSSCIGNGYVGTMIKSGNDRLIVVFEPLP